MSLTHDIDNEGNIFHFDSYEEVEMPTYPSTIGLTADTFEGNHFKSSYGVLSISEDSNERDDSQHMVDGKGKGVTKSIPISIPVAVAHDLFDMSPRDHTAPSTSRNSHPTNHTYPLTSSSLNDPSTSHNDTHQQDILQSQQDLDDDLTCQGSIFHSRKGKEKELPPAIPPFSFSPTEFVYEHAAWSTAMTPVPGPSSFDSAFGLSTTHSSTNVIEITSPGASSLQQVIHPDLSAPPIPILKRMPSRRRSLSNLSVKSTRSLTARSMSRIKLKFSPSGVSGNLTKTFLYSKTKISANGLKELVSGDARDMPCHTAFKVNELDSSAPQLSDFNVWDISSQHPDAFYYKESPIKLRHKGRSHSSPFPISALDFVPLTSKDIFTPIPIIVLNYFDEVLPKELRLQILTSLVGLHEADFLRSVDDDRWTMSKASSSKGRWVGTDKGIRELFRLSRVSKAWQKLVFDGQLWHNLDLRSFPNFPESILMRLTSIGGSFTTRLDVAGHVQLTPTAFLDMIDNLCLPPSPSGPALTNTQLTEINLQGCLGLTSLSLHYVLVRSPYLRRLCVKGLRAVTNTTCDIISTHCPTLAHLDLSRCSNMDAKGILRMSSSAIGRGEHLHLTELRLCGLKNMDDVTMSTLGRAAPYLEVLDLSYVRQLHNSAVEAFIACEGDKWENLGVDTILVSPRDIGREANDLTKCRRRVTRLRHLSMSSCILLTDDACSNLAHSVPRLEFLELAGIGAALKDDGLIRLLNTIPMIRRLDLEDASAISDSVITAITPSINVGPLLKPLVQSPPEPGHALEQLNISYATHISDDAMLDLIISCTRLKWLEADNTHIGSRVIKKFVRLSRDREMVDAKIVAIDCRGISEPFVRELSAFTRPRKGWRNYQARKLMYLDARDKNADELKIGQDECDEKRIVMKSFYSWQTVDAVKSAREKRRKANSRRAMNESGGSYDIDDRSSRWWSPGGRRSPRSGRNSPLDPNSEGCIVM